MAEHMTRQRFLSLSQEERDIWTVRLHQQLGVPLKNTVEFWFDGDLVTGATAWKRDDLGHIVVDGHNAVREHVAPLAYLPGSVSG